MPYNHQQSMLSFARAIPVLLSKGFSVTGVWIFKKDNVEYDLSCADISKIDEIVEKKLFVIE